MSKAGESNGMDLGFLQKPHEYDPGRLYSQTFSSRSSARPVTPPSFQLLGKSFGQVGSNTSSGARCACAQSATDMSVAATAGHRTSERRDVIAAPC